MENLQKAKRLKIEEKIINWFSLGQDVWREIFSWVILCFIRF